MSSELSRAAWLALALAAALGPSCSLRQSVAHPKFRGGGLLKDATPVAHGALARLDGMYRVSNGGVFGTELVALHATDSTVSIFAASNAAYAITRAGCLSGGAEVVFEGAWRYPAATNTGLVRLTLGPPALAAAVCSGDFSALGAAPPAPVLDGTTGDGDALPGSGATFDFDHALKPTQNKFVVVGHHGACATADDCGASENSVEGIRLVEPMGASVVELDVQLSADGVPFLYHDDNFSDRLALGPMCHGPVRDFSIADARAECTLKWGERIPTLDEALAAVVDETQLRGVWLDVKLTDAIEPAQRVVEKYTALAAAKKRKVALVIGLTGTDSIHAYRGMTPQPAAGSYCLVETTPADVRAAGCPIWGPDWTLGPSASDVTAMQAEGRAVVFWTMDEQKFIDSYLTTTTPNGIVTNRPGLVFHRFQTLGTLPADRAQL